MDFPLFDFIFASLLMGLGIGLDVAIATVARSKQLNTFKVATLWILGVSLTHTLFPMVGYLLTYFSVQVLPEITPIIGIIAFLFIFVFLKGELSQLANPENEQKSSQLLVTLGLILAVSWDALWSGPAKSAQVIGWPELMVWLSFILVGVMVAGLAICSLTFSSFILHFGENRKYMGLVGNWLQYSVIGYFGLLALFNYTLQIHLSWWQIFLGSMISIGVCLFTALYIKEHKNFLAT